MGCEIQLQIDAVAVLGLEDRCHSQACTSDAVALVHRAQDSPAGYARRLDPGINQRLEPTRHRHGADTPAFPHEVRKHPAAIPLLHVFNGQVCEFVAPQPAANQQAKQNPVTRPFA